MALKNRIVAFVAGVLFGPALVFAGLETGTYISDLVATNPLSSDLASTADDHLRLIKSTLKTTFPNINNAITVTDEQINAVGASGVTGAANPTGTIGLSAVNGSATTFLRSDGAPALSQAIAPTWTGEHTFTRSFALGAAPAIVLSSSLPLIELDESDAAANNRRWWINATGEVFQLGLGSDDRNSGATFMSADRTGTTVDRVTFPADAVANKFVVGTVNASTAALGQFRGAGISGLSAQITGASGVAALAVHNEATINDTLLAQWRTETGAGTVRGDVTYNRAGGMIVYNTTSADNLKRNIRPAKSARKVIDCIRVVSHDWKDSDAHMDYWVTAGTLNPCASWAVSYDTKPEVDGKVDVSKLVPAMIKYMQEQDARIAKLERRLH